MRVFVHDKNYGYGRNQQTCYREALAAGADIVVMVHPDYQYTPKLVSAMAGMIAYGVYDVDTTRTSRGLNFRQNMLSLLPHERASGIQLR